MSFKRATSYGDTKCPKAPSSCNRTTNVFWRSDNRAFDFRMELRLSVVDSRRRQETFFLPTSSCKNRSNRGKTVQALYCSMRYAEYNGLRTATLSLQNRTQPERLRLRRPRQRAAQMIPFPEDNSDYDREPVDNTTGVQICAIIILTLFIAVKVITEHPEWFGA